MEKVSTIVSGAVVLLVVVVLISFTVVPIVEEAQKSYETTENNTAYKYALVGDSEDLILGFKDGSVAINGEIPDDPIDKSANFNEYFITDTAIVRMTWNATSQNWGSAFYLVDLNNPGTTYSGVFVTTGQISFSNGVMSYSTYTSEYAYLLKPSATGNYASYYIDDIEDVFIDDDSIIYVSGCYNSYGFSAKGTYENIVTQFALAGYDNNVNVVTDDISITVACTPDSYNVSNEITSVTVTGFASPVDTNTEIFVPIEYTIVKEDSSIFFVLLGIIPLLLFIIPIMMVVRLVVGRRD